MINVSPLVLPDHAKFIFNSWIWAFTKVSPWRKVDKNWISAAAHALITRLLSSPKCATLVATNASDPDQIFGFIVFSPGLRMLHWVHVKRDFRGWGIATRMMEAAFDRPGQPIEVTHETRDLHKLARWNMVSNTHGLVEVTKE